MDSLLKQKTELKNQYEQLNLLYQFPRLYLRQYFSDMKTRINLSFAKKERLVQDELLKRELNENWADLSKLVSSIENECLKRIQANPKFDSDINRKIQFLTDNMKSNDHFDAVLIELAYNLITQIESIVFLNKTIIFVENVDLTNDLETSLFGKLIIITNEHLNSLLFKERYFDDKKLTMDTIKLNEIIKISFKNRLVIETSLDLSRVYEVSFSDYNLSSIEASLFTSLTHLVSINMSNNQLSDLDVDVFRSLVNLSHIDLSFNMLSSIHPNLFRNLINLREIFLSNNQLKSVDKNIFNGLVNLSFVDLSCNEIESIDFNIFQGLRCLKFVWLHGNKFKSFMPQIFLVNLKSSKKNFLSLYI